jgi:hypothetical protein
MKCPKCENQVKIKDGNIVCGKCFFEMSEDEVIKTLDKFMDATKAIYKVAEVMTEALRPAVEKVIEVCKKSFSLIGKNMSKEIKNSEKLFDYDRGELPETKFLYPKRTKDLLRKAMTKDHAELIKGLVPDTNHVVCSDYYRYQYKDKNGKIKYRYINMICKNCKSYKQCQSTGTVPGFGTCCIDWLPKKDICNNEGENKCL